MTAALAIIAGVVPRTWSADHADDSVGSANHAAQTD
jgi:hypothetical protein